RRARGAAPAPPPRYEPLRRHTPPQERHLRGAAAGGRGGVQRVDQVRDAAPALVQGPPRGQGPPPGGQRGTTLTSRGERNPPPSSSPHGGLAAMHPERAEAKRRRDQGLGDRRQPAKPPAAAQAAGGCEHGVMYRSIDTAKCWRQPPSPKATPSAASQGEQGGGRAGSAGRPEHRQFARAAAGLASGPLAAPRDAERGRRSACP